MDGPQQHPSDRPRLSPVRAVLAVIALCLVAAIMRPAITAVGPLIDQISADTGIAPAALGALPTVILLTWAVVSPLAHRVGRRWGLVGAVLGATALLAVGLIVRSIPGSPLWLWVGTALIGLALAIGNVLLPAVIKRDFASRVPLMMAVYSAILGGMGAVASGLAVPVSTLTAPADWRLSLLVVGGTLVPLALLCWAWSARRSRADTVVATRRTGGIWRDGTAWWVATYMGVQSTSFYVLVTWLASMSASAGRSGVEAGFDVMIYQIFSIFGSLAVAAFMRGAGARLVPALVPVVGLIGIVGIMVAPAGIGAWVIALGLFSGASLGVSLTLMAQRARDHDTSSALSGMSQSVGYAMAAVGPVLFGVIHSATGSWTLALLLLVTTMLAQVGIGAMAARERFVLDPR